MRSAFLRSTPFRLTLIMGAAFVLALALSGATALHLIRNELAARMDRALLNTFTVIARTYGDGDLTDLTESVTSHAGSAIEHDRVYALVAPGGAMLAGNVGRVPAGDGWLTVPADAVGLEGGPYRLYLGEAGLYRLLVGSSFAETTAIGRIAFTGIAWAAAILVALIVCAALVVTARGQRRLDGIAATMQRIGQGELDARIAVSGRGDDIDALVGEVNVGLDRLSRLVEGMRQVSVDIAHDLKTPLNRLAITMEAAIEADEAGEPVGALLLQAEDEGRRINATFDALLRIAQIEAGARRSRFTALDPQVVIDSIADIYGEVAVEHGQTLRRLEHHPLSALSGDHELLVQMMANLVENAIRHCPPGAEISVGGTMRDAGVELIVADTGPGIPQDEREKVFQRLYRIEKSRTKPGNGLGLSLVRAIAELHGAVVTLADNAPGLIVLIRFPVTRRDNRTDG